VTCFDILINLRRLNMNSVRSAPTLVISVIVFAGISIVILTMRTASGILSPVLLALVLAITASPLLSWFMRKGAPSWLALILTIILVVGLILGIVWLVGLSVQDFGEKLPPGI
jgi:predicted PurR-regulated permease PerM